MLRLYVVKNEASEMYAPPIPCVNDEHAKQTFKQLMLGSENNRIAADEMNLYYTGCTFDESTGTITNKEEFKMIQEGKIYGRKEIDWADIMSRNPQTIQSQQ